MFVGKYLKSYVLPKIGQIKSSDKYPSPQSPTTFRCANFKKTLQSYYADKSSPNKIHYISFQTFKHDMELKIVQGILL